MNRRSLLAFLGITTAAAVIPKMVEAYVPPKPKFGGIKVDLPIGLLMPWSPNANAIPPDNWLICDGRAVTRSHYHELFKVIGIIYGRGDNESTFNIPDLRGIVREPVFTVGKYLGNGEHEAVLVNRPTFDLVHIIRAL